MCFSVHESSLWGGLLSVLSVLRESFHCWCWGRTLLRLHLYLYSTFPSIFMKTGNFKQQVIIAYTCIYTHNESLYAVPVSNTAVQVLGTVLAFLAASTPCSVNVKLCVRWWIHDKYLEDLANILLWKFVDVMYTVIFSLQHSLLGGNASKYMLIIYCSMPMLLHC